MRTSGGVIALDLAAVVGHAHASEAYCRAWVPELEITPGSARQFGLTHGSTRVSRPEMEDGAIGAAFGDWLADQITVHQPAVCVIERFIPHPKAEDAGVRGIGLYWTAATICFRRDVPVYLQPSSTIKKYATGDGRAD